MGFWLQTERNSVNGGIVCPSAWHQVFLKLKLSVRLRITPGHTLSDCLKFRNSAVKAAGGLPITLVSSW